MSTLTFSGTGGVWEGNAGAANVNVNLESAPRFDETASGTTNSYITGADINDMEVATYSIMCWFKSIPSNGSQQNDATGWLIGKDNTVQIGFHNTTGTVRCYSRPGGSWSTVTTSTTDCRNSWHHACLTWDGSNNKLYIDGKLEATVAASGAAAAGNSNKFMFGAKGQDDDQYEGYIKDVKLYSAVLDATAIGIAAQKINTDLELIGNVSDCEAWYKFDDSTDSTPEDSTTNNNDCTATGADVTWVHDAFSVNVQDNSTTTDGAVTVTQGKLEGLSLTSHDFDGADDYITVADAASLDGMDALTISVWVKPTDAGDSTQRILEKAYDSAYSLAINRGSNDYYYMYINDNALVGTTGSVTYGAWQHVVMTYDSTGSGTGRLYLNGVLNAEDTTFSGSAVGANSSNLIIAARTNLDGSARLDGGLRDIKMFKQALSADQVASLYSGSFNVTPRPSFSGVRGTAFRANGGPVMGGGSYIVGERGPEMFSPGVSGMITPNHALGGSTNVVVNVDAAGSSVEGNEEQGRELGRLISAAVQSEIIQQKRPGGILA